MSNDDKKYELDHEYDGIKELDYPLPKWWLLTFYGAIIFGMGYFYHYSISDGTSLREDYKDKWAKFSELKDQYLEELSEFDSSKFDQFYSSPEMVGYGKEVYQQNCVACHRANGAGDIGPNLSDRYWLYSEGTPETIYPFIIAGNPQNGMPSWGLQLSEDDLYAVTSYIMSFQDFKHEKAKEPQGEEFPEYVHPEVNGEK